MPIIEKICPICGNPFRCWKRNAKREHRTCSVKCGSILRYRTRPKHVPKDPKRHRHECEFCHNVFWSRDKGDRFCTHSCASKAMWADPLRKRMLRNPIQRRASSERMRRLNKDPVVRAKSSATARGRSFRGIRGGNGQLTIDQLLLAEALGWPVEYSVTTGVPNWRTATVDIANPELKIAVECDGNSHLSRKQKNRDVRKGKILTDLGWIVLRFWNSEISKDVDSVLDRIRNEVKKRSSIT